MTTDYIIVLVTTSNKSEAEKIAQTLLKEKLVACVNIINSVTSFFHWKKNIDCAEECLLIMKTRKNQFSQIAECVKALHSYEVPEVLALPIVLGSEKYLQWVDDSLKQ